jgi:hypothetical protein
VLGDFDEDEHSVAQVREYLLAEAAFEPAMAFAPYGSVRGRLFPAAVSFVHKNREITFEELKQELKTDSHTTQQLLDSLVCENLLSPPYKRAGGSYRWREIEDVKEEIELHRSLTG